jgi:hypothetical protein
VIIVAAVLVVHVMLAIWVRDHANRKLSEMPENVAFLDIGYAQMSQILFREFCRLRDEEVADQASPILASRDGSIRPSTGRPCALSYPRIARCVSLPMMPSIAPW